MFYGLCLLSGVLLFGIAGLLHPMLEGDGAAQLTTIAATGGWRAIHWSLLFALPLIYIGLSGVALRHGDTAGSSAARGGIRLAAFTFAVWSLNILFMVAGGWNLARAYTASDTGLTASHAVFVYDMLHPSGLAAERLATFSLALVVYLFGRAMLEGGVFPRWLGRAAFVVALVNGAVAVVFSETSPNLFYGQALVIIWLAAAAGVMLAERRRAV